jgi:arylsulfatase A-like enzyme
LSGPALPTLGLKGGQRFPHLFHVVDWLPTIAEALEILPRKAYALDGKSQLTSLKQGGPPTRQELFVGYSQADTTNQWYGPAIRYRNWKIVQGTSGGPDQFNDHPEGSIAPLPGGLLNSTYLLFDLKTDPMEESDVAHQYPEVVQALRYKLATYQQSYVPPQANDDSSCPFTGLVNTSVGPTWYVIDSAQ